MHDRQLPGSGHSASSEGLARPCWPWPHPIQPLETDMGAALSDRPACPRWWLVARTTVALVLALLSPVTLWLDVRLGPCSSQLSTPGPLPGQLPA